MHIPKLNKFFGHRKNIHASAEYFCGGGLTEFLFHVLADVQLLLYITAFFAVLSTHRCIYSFLPGKVYISKFSSSKWFTDVKIPQSPPGFCLAVIRATVCFSNVLRAVGKVGGHIFSTDSVFFVCGELHSGNYVKTTPEKLYDFRCTNLRLNCLIACTKECERLCVVVRFNKCHHALRTSTNRNNNNNNKKLLLVCCGIF